MILNQNLAVRMPLRVKEKNNPEKKSKKEKLNQSLVDVNCEKNEDNLRKHLPLKLGGFFLHEILQVLRHRQF